MSNLNDYLRLANLKTMSDNLNIVFKDGEVKVNSEFYDSLTIYAGMQKTPRGLLIIVLRAIKRFSSQDQETEQKLMAKIEDILLALVNDEWQSKNLAHVAFLMLPSILQEAATISQKGPNE